MPAKRASIAEKTRLSMIQKGQHPENPEWAEFYDLYCPFVRAVAINEGLGQEDAEDLAQNVMTELSRKMDGFVYDPKSSFRGFLKTVARRRVIDWKRKPQPQHDPKKRVHRPPGQEGRTGTIARIPDKSPGPLADNEEAEWRAAITRRALATLKANAKVSDSHYQIFEAIVGLQSVEGICSTLGVTQNTVSIVKHRLHPIFDEAVKEAMEYVDAPRIPDGESAEHGLT